MTVNALSSIASTPVSGLGVQTYNVITAGFYTLSCESFIPYLAAGSVAQSATAVNEVQNITFVADSSGSLNSTYFTFNSATDLYGFYVWFNINGAGVDPAPAGLTGIAVAGATNATAATLAAAAVTAILANTNAAASVTPSVVSSTHLLLTYLQPGATTAAANGTASPGFTYSVSTTGTFGTPAQSGLTMVFKKNTTVLLSTGFPSPTQPMLSAQTTVSCAANDTLTVTLASLSAVDNVPNAVKSVMNVFPGPV